MSYDDWEDPYDNDDDNDLDYYHYLPNEYICEIGFFEYENSIHSDQGQENDIMFIMNDHLKYSLGASVLTNYNNIFNLFHGHSILIKTFYEFPLTNIHSFLRWNIYEQEGSFTDIKPPSLMKLDILQTFIKPILQDNNENVALKFEATVVIKTIWLSLVQRHWKKVLKIRKDFLLKMKSFAFLASREINGNYVHCFNPCLKGMLSVYKK